ncbi:MAG: hypothetical protein JW880_04090 [Candidatus Thermoplasmatota archaeon]|nr:hypothetical protein [Candidatus Thermoplasmatota archaeon]
MEEEHLKALREAFESRRRKESLEEAVGRVARKRGLDFSAYVRIMSEVRERARDDGKTVDETAQAILGKGSKDSE